MATVEDPPDQQGATRLEVAQSRPDAPVPALRALPPEASPPAKRRIWLWGAGLATILGLGLLAASQLWLTRPPLVSVETAALAPVTRVLAVNGRIAAVDSVALRPVVSGTLIGLPVAEGDLVAAGQPLAQIDAASQEAVVRQASAGLDAARLVHQQANEAHDRAVALGPNIAATALEAAAHAVQAAEQDVARLAAALDQARIGLAHHTLRAPMAGTILALDAELGQVVGPSAPLMTLADLGALVVEADVDEAYATQIAVGQRAVAQLAGETRTREGVVRYVSTQVDVATGGLAIEIALDDPLVAPIGLTVATNIIVDQRPAALTVPRTALRTDTGESGIFLLRDGRAAFQPISVVDWPAERLVVSSGLGEGDTVILDGTGLVDGQAVAVDRP